MFRPVRHWLKLVFGLATLYFACVWARFLPRPAWLPADVEPLTVIAGVFLFLLSWWEEILEKVAPQALPREPKHLANPQRHLVADAIGRRTDLRRLRRRLREARKPLTVVGVGGLGKTTLLQLFWQKYRKQFDHVAYLTANAVFSGDRDRRVENAAHFLNAFLDHAALKENLKLVLDPRDPPETQFGQLVGALARVPGRNLLMIDNATEAAAAHLATLSGLEGWKILLSSRDAIQHTEHFELDALAPADAARLFWRIYDSPRPIRPTTQSRRTNGTGNETADLDAILRGIGYHTLTIELIAAYAREKRLSGAGLFDELQARGLRGLDAYEIVVPKSDRIQSLNAHLRDTFLLELSPAEKTLMRNMCILPTDGAPVEPALMSEEKLRDYLGQNDDPAGFHNTLRGLVKLHWLTERDGSFWCHPVIAETAKLQLEPDAEQCRTLVESMAAWLEPDENEPPIRRARFVPLGEAVLAGVYRAEGRFTEADLSVGRLALLLGNVFRDLGVFQKALECEKKAVLIREKVLPEEHPDLATSYNNLSATLWALGEHQKSLEFNRKAFAIREQVLPKDHPDLAQSYNNLAEIHRALGEHQKSLKFNRKALAIWEKSLPENHPDLATSYNNLSLTYGELGNHSKRLEFNHKALSIWEKVLPADHPGLAQSYNNLAETHRALGEHQKSLKFNRKALAIWEKSLPENHPDLAVSYNNLALTYGALGDHQKELEFILKALAIQEKVLPEDHPDLATSYNNLALTWRDLGDLDQAYTFMQKAAAIWEKSLPPAHPHVEMVKKRLATLERERREKGKNRQA